MMSIDEYLNEFKAVRRKIARMSDRIMKAEVRAYDVRSPGDMGDGTPSGHRGGNAHETKLINYADIRRKYRAAWKAYEEMRDSLRAAIDVIPCWAGCLIHHVYLYNVVFNEPDELKGADAILGTQDRNVIKSKLIEAKTLLADALRAQGVPIE